MGAIAEKALTAKDAKIEKQFTAENAERAEKATRR
jgi:hypothetical protein